MIHAVNTFFPITGNIKEGIQVLSDLYERIGYIDLPKNNFWIDNLSILGCINVSPFFVQNNLEEQFFNSLDGYTCVGVKRENENYQKVLELLDKHRISHNILIEHELNQGHVRLCIPQKQQIEELYSSEVINFNGISQRVNIKISEEQKSCLKQIFDLCSKDTIATKQVREKFVELLNSYESIKQIIEWRNKIGTTFNLTSIGKVIAHANAKKIDTTLPDLD